MQPPTAIQRGLPAPPAPAGPLHQLAHRDADQPAQDQGEEQPQALEHQDPEAHHEPAGERRADRARRSVRAQPDDRGARLPRALGALDADRRVDHAVGADRPLAVRAGHGRLAPGMAVADGLRGRGVLRLGFQRDRVGPLRPRADLRRYYLPLSVDSDGLDELVDRDRGQRLVVRRAARAELQRHLCHRLLVGRLDDVHEVEPAERRPTGAAPGRRSAPTRG